MPRTDAVIRDHNVVEHIINYCEQLSETLQEINFDRDRFLASHTYQNAVAMCILQIGELVKQLSEEFTEAHPEIPWRIMARTRDQYAHHYGSLDFSLIWDTATLVIPMVYESCKKIVSHT